MARMSAVGPIDWRPGPGWVHAAGGQPLVAEHVRVLGLAGIEGLDAMPTAPLHIEDQSGDRRKREKPWPVDRSIVCYTSRESRGLHIVMPCRWYAGVVTRTVKTGGVMLPIETVTVQDGFDRGKGLCACWDAHFHGERVAVPGAGEGHRL